MSHNPAGDRMAEVKITRIVYKAALHENGKTRCVIALGIPEDARVIGHYFNGGGKERTNKAITLAIAPITSILSDATIATTPPTRILIVLAHAMCPSASSLIYCVHEDYQYTVGHLQTPDKEFNSDSRVSCASGIHFYDMLKTAVKFAFTKNSSKEFNITVATKSTEDFAKIAEHQAQRYNDGHSLLLPPTTM
jgi:hypothetical protein